MDKNQPANEDMGSIPGPEGFHMLLRNGVFPALISKLLKDVPAISDSVLQMLISELQGHQEEQYL